MGDRIEKEQERDQKQEQEQEQEQEEQEQEQDHRSAAQCNVYTALYSHADSRPGCLEFVSGEIIIVDPAHSTDGSTWWYGSKVRRTPCPCLWSP